MPVRLLSAQQLLPSVCALLSPGGAGRGVPHQHTAEEAREGDQPLLSVLDRNMQAAAAAAACVCCCTQASHCVPFLEQQQQQQPLPVILVCCCSADLHTT
jgi:hypothetical protein